MQLSIKTLVVHLPHATRCERECFPLITVNMAYDGKMLGRVALLPREQPDLLGLCLEALSDAVVANDDERITRAAVGAVVSMPAQLAQDDIFAFTCEYCSNCERPHYALTSVRRTENVMAIGSAEQGATLLGVIAHSVPGFAAAAKLQ